MAKIYKSVNVEKSVYEELVKAQALLQLMEAKKISLSDTIRRALEELPKADLVADMPKNNRKQSTGQ